MRYIRDKPNGTYYMLSNDARTGQWTQSSSLYTQWGIGGSNLLMNQTCNTSAAYTTAVDNYYGSATRLKIPYFGAARARTAIGYRSSDDKIVLGIFYGADIDKYDDGPTIYQLYLIMKHYFGCTLALSLDGGGSSKIKYKSNGIDKTMNGDGRNVYSMLALTTAAANSCTW